MCASYCLLCTVTAFLDVFVKIANQISFPQSLFPLFLKEYYKINVALLGISVKGNTAIRVTFPD